MNATIKLLDKYRETCSLTSDNAVAVSLGLSRSTVSLWRGEKGHPEADSVEKMCASIGEPLRKWLPLIEAERARSPAVRKVWLRMAQAAASLAVIYLFSRLGVHAHEAFLASGLYIMRNYGLICLILALAACAALRNGGSKQHAWILE